jgi:hypothetical protein
MFRNGILALFGLAAVTACSAGTTTDTGATAEALTEATASADDAKATADACFATFEACTKADGADVDACRATLKTCLPADAHPGPHCGPPRGKGKGNPHGPNGGACDKDGGADRPEGPPPPDGSARPEGPPPPDGSARPAGPPPPDGSARPEGPPPPDGEGGGGKGGHGGEPGFCKKVPLPPPAEVIACRDALDTCVAGTTDDAAKKACLETHHACVKAAFDAARTAAAGSAQ